MTTSVDTSNYVYLCMTLHFWGSGKSEAEAYRNCQRAGGGGSISKYGHLVYRVHPDFQIDDIDGAVRTPIGHPAIKVTDKRKQKQTA